MIKDLVKKISKITKTNFYDLVTVTKDWAGKDKSYNLNSSKIKKELKWKAKVDIYEGLIITLQWIDNNFSYLRRQKLNYIHKK